LEFQVYGAGNHLLREEVQAQIRKLILTNGLHPGQPIVIDQLSRKLGVSHTPIREALAMLQHDGLVQLRLYGHPRVAEIEPFDVRGVWQMRMLLEGWAIKKATLTLPDDELDRMEGMLRRAGQEAGLTRFDSHLESDVALHGMILRSIENNLFARPSQLVSDQSIVLMSIHSLFILVELGRVLGPGINISTVIIGVVTWMGTARLVRAEILSLKEQDFVIAAGSIGAPSTRSLIRHLLPDVIATIAVSATLRVGQGIIMEAALSLPELGAQLPASTWGSIPSQAQGYLRDALWIAFFPCFLILITVLCVNSRRWPARHQGSARPPLSSTGLPMHTVRQRVRRCR
jgi:DNA-binding GntR family transcriptional regulator